MKRFVIIVVAALCLLAAVSIVKVLSNKGNQTVDLAHPQPGPTNQNQAGSIVANSMGTSAAVGNPQPGQAPVSVSTNAVNQADPTSAVGRRRKWDPEFLTKLGNVREGENLRLELVGGEWATAVIQQLQHKDGSVTRVAGLITEPESGRFFFQRQSMPGKAGEFVGLIEFPKSKRAYRIEPSGETSELVERPLDGVVCLQLPRAASETNQVEEIPPLNPGDFPTVSIPAYQTGIVVLESLPGATAVLYLDYQGGYTATWGGITYARPVASNAEIRDVWKRVSEDYMPFNINVTTDLGVFQRAPENSRKRVIITPTTTAAPGAGGVAYVGSFNWTGDTPCWSFYATGKNAAEAIAHEAGHTLGLSHDGADVNGVHTEYYGGQGSGATGWAPIMGVGYGMNVTQWSKGEYSNANNHEDDLAIISGNNNNVDYRADDTGESLADARYLEIFASNVAKTEGVIERTGDTDAFRFSTTGGAMSLRADPVGDWSDLAIQAALLDAAGNVLATSNPQTTLFASISKTLTAGNYTFQVTGSGRNNALTTGFSSYASLGYYKISGTVAGVRLPSRFTIPENTPNGTLVGIVSPINTGADTLSYTIASGNVGGAFAIDNAGNLTVQNSAILDYETLAAGSQLSVQFEMFVNIADVSNGSLTEIDRRVVVAITDVNEAPTAHGFDVSVFEHSQIGMIVGQVTADDPDFHTVPLFSIVGGNDNGMFNIGKQSGQILVAGDLAISDQNSYHLEVQVSDQGKPTPITANAFVNVTVLKNSNSFHPGSINYAVYTNITGNAVSAMTSSSSFPYDPAFEKPLPTFEGDTDRGDDYGAVIRGYLIPPVTGSYKFWIATDDDGELWLSPSASPASIARIAFVSGAVGVREWTRTASQQSTARSLIGGTAYYIEARMKEGGGDDHIAVAWECTSANITRDVIPGRFLAPFSPNYTPRASSFATALHKGAVTGSRVGSVNATDVNSADTLSFVITGGNTAGIFSINSTNGLVRVADETALAEAVSGNIQLTVRVSDNGTPVRTKSVANVITLVAPGAITTKTLQQEIWKNIGGGTAVSDLTSQTKYPKRPDALRAITSFDSGENYGDNYGSRVRAYLTPKTSGSYTFFIASDDGGSLKFGQTNAPAAATQIASVSGSTSYQQWTQFASQKSTARTLTAGQTVYLEALQKEGGGEDHLSVGWKGPGLTGTNVIAASFLSPPDINFAPELSGKSVTLFSTATNGSSVTTMTAKDSPVDPIACKIVGGDINNAFSIDVDSGVIRVANSAAIGSFNPASYSLTIQAQDSGYGDLYPRKSTNVIVNIQITTPAALVWSGGGAGANWSEGANWSGTVPLENSPLTFAGTLNQNNFNDLLSQAGSIFIQNGGFHIDGNALNLTSGILSIGDNVWAINTALTGIETITNQSGNLTLAGTIDIQANLLTLQVNESALVSGAITGLGELTKTGPGILTLEAENTFFGNTTISEGALAISGAGAVVNSPLIAVQSGAKVDVSQLAAGFTIATGQTLYGSGAVVGNVSVHGIISPGESLGSMTFSNNLALAGTTTIEINKTATDLQSDQIFVKGTLSLGGNLTLLNLGSSLAAGDSFKIFDAASVTGSFDSLNPPSPGPGLIWDKSQLVASGILRVGAAADASSLAFSLNGSNIELQLPSAIGVSYILEQSSDLGSPANWSPISTNGGTGGVLSFPVPIDAQIDQRYYRIELR